MRTIGRFILSITMSAALIIGENRAQSDTLMIFGQAAIKNHVATPERSPIKSKIKNQKSKIEDVVVDRLAAVVNGDPITESDLLWLLALDAEVPIERITNEQKHTRLEQAIDQQLLYQEAQKLPSLEVGQDEIAKFIAELTTQFSSESAFRRRRNVVGLDDATLREIARRQLVILNFIEFRFRSFVFVTSEEIQSYYQSRIVQPTQESGETPPALDDKLRNTIERTIIEDKVDAELTVWFDEARRRSEIIRLVEY